METKFTKGNLYPVEYAGRWDIQDGEFYGDDSVLDAESVGEETAEANAKLFAAAPDLLEALIYALDILDDQAKKGHYPEKALLINGGNGLITLKQAIQKATE